MFPTEVSITAALTAAWPNLLPGLLGTDLERRWMLMQPFAGRLLHEESEIERWEAVLVAYAGIQVGMAGNNQFLTASGCLDRRLKVLFAQCDQMLADEAFLLGPGGMSADELALVRALVPELRAIGQTLEAAGVPYTLEHGDLHPGNAACSQNSITIFDWSDASLSHPFFTLALFLDEMQDTAIPNSPEVKDRLRDAYLRQWSAYASHHELLAVLKLAWRLSYIHYALSYYWYIIPADDEQNFVTTPVRFLRRLLGQN